MDMSAIFADIGVGLSAQFSGPLKPGSVVRTSTPTTDDGGSIVTPGIVSIADCSVQVENVTEAMRQADGYTDEDMRLLVLAATLEGTIDTDAEIEVLTGPYFGRWSVASVASDPFGAYWDCRGRLSSTQISRYFAGTSIAVAAVSGDLTADCRLFGIVGGVSAVSGAGRRDAFLTGAPSATGSTSAAVTLAANYSGASGGAATVVGALALDAKMAGVAAGVLSASGSPALAASLAGTAAPQTSATGELLTVEAIALFARMTVQPDATRKGLINSLIYTLKQAGVWTKLDALYLIAAHSAQAARLNLISTNYTLVASNSPTFTTDRGYTGDASSSFLDSGFNPITATTPLFTQNDCHQGVWVGTTATSSAMYELGSARSRINTLSAASAAAVLPSEASIVTVALPSNTAIGHTMWSRYTAASHEAFKNGASVGTGVLASATPFSVQFYLLGYANTGPTLTSPSSRRVQAAHWGSQLSPTQAAALYNAFAAYMTAIGA